MDSAAGGVYTKGLRLKHVRYPDGRLVHYRYGEEGSRDEMISRLATIQDDSGGLPGQVLSSYAYAGLGRIVSETYPQPQVTLDYFQGASGAYAGFDRFGRIRDQKWLKMTDSSVLDRYGYGHDYNSNRLYRENAVTHGTVNKFDEFYGYDNLNRLITADRGTLDDPPTEGLLTTNYKQAWGLSPVGNWDEFKEGTGSAWTLEQERTHNLVNEITGITEGEGQSAWVVPAYDARGNMTSGPKPGAETTRIHMKYDAWNRMVEVKADDGGSPGTLIATYRCDGLDHRIAKLIPHGENWDRTDVYYNNRWQSLEERYAENQADKDAPATATRCQFIWGIRYIHSPVLRDRDADGQSWNGLEERLYYCNDANFNVTALINTFGTVVERYTYDPYGKVTFRTADWGARTESAYDNDVLYTGQRLDTESGLYYFLMRYYHPTLGRLITREPIEARSNLYEYVSGRPTIARDPLGLFEFDPNQIEMLRIAMEEILPWAAEQLQESGEKAKEEKVKTQIKEWEKDPHYITTIAFPAPSSLPPAVGYGPIMEDTPCANAYMYSARARGDGTLYNYHAEKYYGDTLFGQILTVLATKGHPVPTYLKKSVEQDWGGVTMWIQKDPYCCKCSLFKPYIEDEISLFNDMRWRATPADKRLNRYAPPACFVE